jgi:hypothetical protein
MKANVHLKKEHEKEHKKEHKGGFKLWGR